MSRDRFYLEHILECIGRIEDYTKGEKQVFFSSNLVQDGVIRNLQILAESTTRLSEEFKAEHPELEWAAIKGLRNILVHGYLNISLGAVWDIVSASIPSLKAVVEKALEIADL